MAELTQSLRHWLFKNHPSALTQIMFGHIEVFTPDMQKEYLEWCKTEEGRSYLEGGANHRAVNNKEEGDICRQ